ncbi:propionate catabolism operon regulatory protein PrpR [bacterium M00.F.Ca.ET.228.01.1.1]|uniref:propionate catabolism operon regulatory protein PrpR n=1 Tax=Paraburkholderia phenoliruptrix TaxID=252970 RepID=UPI001091A8D8|nr:propionate catabolism operon regulatory protein PrpR [Paraburkholderia phenoliruptrix]TGP39618.1 propionate catabolism operon regulatory protein PrpR [bacterium M00.F.Ca.ET.228.01.1.1]TGR95451.1 propionate catabolism operon regulatory protein PrpR [bacterium M00.F.Ca.ET.191.01.1.1]TGT96377.1 propionate catabolism operon regulatory protein PrpR [bacterium M00.F.Ca.ET.155.01.1.1]MBW0450771.1 propionate catabolism operon regulatory protein PrpR [Paraburkholderia phenoliruptrix]MBW9101779.1 pro
MSTVPFDTAPRPRIWALSISRLRDLFLDIAGEYVERADLRIVARGFEDAVREIEAAGAGRPDVVIAGGSNGAYLKTRVAVPVVMITPTGFDVMHALARARRDGAKVALVTHGNTPDEIRRFVAAFGLDVTFASHQSAQDAESVVLDLRDRGIDVVVGPGLVTDLAANAGMGAVFLYSRASVRAGFETALEVAQATRRETLRRQRLDNLLQHLRDGVVALDAEGRVEAMNQRLAAVLGIDAANAAGRALLELAPDLAGSLPDSDGDAFCTVRGASYVVHRGPLASGGAAAAGTVLTFQESRAVERLDRTLRSRQRVQQFSARYRLDDMVGASQAMQRVRGLVQRYARSDATVLILGESGTGKEMVAQSMHQLSARRDFAFVAINCGAFPEALLESELFGYEEGAFTGARKGGKAGLIEVAHRGTLFLDEIGEMPLSLQSRLLRVLQEREVVRLGSTEPTRVDIRVVAATHRALTEGIATGSFRADLYYRLNILSIALPPLRERSADLLPLAVELLLQAAAREPRLAARLPDAAAAERVLAALAEPLQRYAWPGNVRELQNVIERIAVELADMDADNDAETGNQPLLTRDILRSIAPEIAEPAHTRPKKTALTLRERSRHVEADEIRAALAAHGGDRDAVCDALGISKTTLWRKLNAAR